MRPYCLCVAANAWLAAWAASHAALAGGAEQPEALRRAHEARARIHTSRLELLYTREPDLNTPAHFLSLQTAGDDRKLVDRGDDRGVVVNTRGWPGIEILERAPRISVEVGDEVWTRTESMDDVRVRPRSRGPKAPDVRCLGLDPGSLFDCAFEDRVRLAGRDVTYSEQSDGALRRVDARFDDGSWAAWWIDPGRDWSVVRTQVGMNDDLWTDRRITVEHCDGVWYPTRIESLIVGPDGARSPGPAIDILHAEFNRPEHPGRLHPADVGLEPGMLVQRDGGDPNQPIPIWDGEKVTSPPEFFERMHAGRVRMGPTVMREQARRWITQRRLEGAPATRPIAASPARAQSDRAFSLSEWEAYTMRFIAQHALDAAQAERALLILRDCQDSVSYLVRQRGLVEQGRGRSDPPDAAAGAQLEKIAARLQDAFENRLVPRLHSLLTSAQRERAASATTRPAEP